MPAEPLRPDLIRFILDAFYEIPPSRRWGYRWIMNQEWLDECRKIAEPPRVADIYLQLMGLPIEARPDGGVPHLEWAP